VASVNVGSVLSDVASVNVGSVLSDVASVNAASVLSDVGSFTLPNAASVNVGSLLSDVGSFTLSDVASVNVGSLLSDVGSFTLPNAASVNVGSLLSDVVSFTLPNAASVNVRRNSAVSGRVDSGDAASVRAATRAEIWLLSLPPVAQRRVFLAALDALTLLLMWGGAEARLEQPAHLDMLANALIAILALLNEALSSRERP
jgi:PPE-repeat protein